eukprot:3709782-Prymnesium_polylepis.1
MQGAHGAAATVGSAGAEDDRTERMRGAHGAAAAVKSAGAADDQPVRMRGAHGAASQAAWGIYDTPPTPDKLASAEMNRKANCGAAFPFGARGFAHTGGGWPTAGGARNGLKLYPASGFKRFQALPNMHVPTKTACCPARRPC